jgi:hypothetical protein
MRLSIKNLTDCWWQIPPFGKDFQLVFPLKKGKIAKDVVFRKSGTTIAWLKAGLGP